VYLSDTDDGRSSEEEENRDPKKMSEGIGRRTSSSSSSSSSAAAAASWPPGRKKNKQALQLRIAQEEERKRKGDRDLTPTVRALTWAFRGAQGTPAIAAVLEDLRFTISTFTSVIQKLGMEGNPQAAIALFRWLQEQQQEVDNSVEQQQSLVVPNVDQQQSFLVPNVYTYNSLLGALKANGCYEFAVRILGETMALLRIL
jgi:hypothetical protein